MTTNGGSGEGDLPYMVIYRVTEKQLVRADNLLNRTQLPTIDDGVVVERWNDENS